MPTIKTVNRLLSVTMIALLIGACASSSTGRKQILLYSEDQLSQMGAQSFDAMKQQQKLSQRSSTNRYITCIANAITAHVPTAVFAKEWEVVVFDEPQVNAFALPGGKIGVYTGLLDVAVNQDQLAAVIGHEVAHVLEQHGNERMSQSSLIGIGQQAVAAALQANEVAYSQPIMQALGLGLQFGVALPYSRAHESEADIVGLDLMARAGFNPEQAVNLWQNMGAQGGQRPPEFMSTHPAPETRIADIRANLPRAKALFQQSNRRPDCQ